jgi:ABC-type phosphate transport system substrate-binding protein
MTNPLAPRSLPARSRSRSRSRSLAPPSAFRCTSASRALLATLVGTTLTLLSASAAAQTQTPTVPCVDAAAGRGKVLYIAGSSAVKPFLAQVSQVLSAEGTTIIYQAQGSCTGVASIFEDAAEKRILKDIPAVDTKAANYAAFFQSDGTAKECFLDLDPAEDVESWPTVDIGVSDVFSDSCGYAASTTAEITDYFGAVQPFVFAVPAASSQRVISQEAAYLAFGLGGYNGTSLPWTDPQYFFVRNQSSGTQQLISRAIGVPAEQWWGGDRGGSGSVVKGLTLLVDPAVAEKAIGILSTDFTEKERANLRVLAFQPSGQSCGLLPDASASSREKRNVREGRYPIWGPLHLFARTTNGLPTDAAGALVLKFATPKIDQVVLDAEIDGGVVPQCAMRVTRTDEMGEIKPYNPPFPCGCYYDQRTNGKTDCSACSVPADCGPTQSCNLGYCEEVK